MGLDLDIFFQKEIKYRAYHGIREVPVRQPSLFGKGGYIHLGKPRIDTYIIMNFFHQGCRDPHDGKETLDSFGQRRSIITTPGNGKPVIPENIILVFKDLGRHKIGGFVMEGVKNLGPIPVTIDIVFDKPDKIIIHGA